MNKIVIVGHPDSGHTQVEKLLFRCGMQPANPSRRDGLTASEVIGSICREMQVPAIDEITNPDEYRQIKPGTVWNGLVLDLMLGNLEQDLWGWADSQALFLMEYLQGLDTQFTFVLVYNDPKSVLLEPHRNLDRDGSDRISKDRLDNWTAYNAAMLHFFLRNHSRCILVHARGVQIAVEQYLSMLQARLSAPLQVPLKVNAGESTKPVTGRLPSPSGSDLISTTDTLESALTRIRDVTHLSADDFMGGNAESFLIDQLLLKHSASRQLFEELQASSNLPIAPEAEASSSAEAAWKAFLKQRWIASQLVARIHRDSQVLEAANLRHAEEQLRLHEKFQLQEEALASGKLKLQQQKLELQQQKAESKRSAKEQKQLLDKLTKAQEKVKNLLLENSKLKQKPKKPVKPAAPPAPTGAPERVKAQLSYRLGVIMTQKSKSLTGLLGLPFALAKEKKKYHGERLKGPGEKLPPLHKYADYHLAEQVKNQLSYRLGNAVVRHSSSLSGWFRMPFSIFHQISEFNRQKAAKKE